MKSEPDSCRVKERNAAYFERMTVITYTTPDRYQIKNQQLSLNFAQCYI